MDQRIIDRFQITLTRAIGVARVVSKLTWPEYSENRQLLASEGPNPYYGVIANNGGLGLSEYYGTPYSIMTPMGEWRLTWPTCIGSDAWIKPVVEAVRLTPYWHDGLDEEGRPAARRTQMGEFGPIWSIGQDTDGVELPPIEVRPTTLWPGIYTKETEDFWKLPRTADSSQAYTFFKNTWRAIARTFPLDWNTTHERPINS